MPQSTNPNPPVNVAKPADSLELILMDQNVLCNELAMIVENVLMLDVETMPLDVKTMPQALKNKRAPILARIAAYQAQSEVVFARIKELGK